MSSRSMPMNMLRTRRRDNNVKPNRRLDRKSSRGMIYENEELRLRTININAEIERGQNDIKKLRRENEMLKKEIWCLRDEYEKLDKLLKDKEIGFSSSSTTSDSESCSSCAEDEEPEKPDKSIKILNQEFGNLSVVVEESAENSDKAESTCEGVLKADQSYPREKNEPRNFFSQIRPKREENGTLYPNEFYQKVPMGNVYQNIVLLPKGYQNAIDPMEKSSTDLIAKTDNAHFQTPPPVLNGVTTPQYNTLGAHSQSTFSNGGNLEELLKDIETISKDILALSNSNQNIPSDNGSDRAYISELNLTLMPHPMPLITMDKYKDISRSLGTTPNRSMENIGSNHNLANEGITYSQDVAEPSKFAQYAQTSIESSDCPIMNTTPVLEKRLFYHSPQISVNEDSETPKVQQRGTECFGMVNATKSNEEISVPKNETNEKKDCDSQKLQRQNSTPIIEADQNSKDKKTPKKKNGERKESKKTKLGLRKKVSIHFKGRKEKDKKAEPPSPTIKVHSATSTPTMEKKSDQLEAKKDKSDRLSDKQRKSSSTSPDRKHVQLKDEKHRKKHKSRKARPPERSYSVCTDRSNYGFREFLYDDYFNSERDSMSSCETFKTVRKMSNGSNIPMAGKVPWCGCWGNGCI